MEHDLRLTAFWVIHLLMLGLFLVEIAFVGSAWLQARVLGLSRDTPCRRKLGATISFALKLIVSRRIWVLQWYDAPKVAERQLAWVPKPHPCARPSWH